MAIAYADRLFHLQDCKEKSGRIAPAAFLISIITCKLGRNDLFCLAPPCEQRRGCRTEEQHNWRCRNISSAVGTARAAAG